MSLCSFLINEFFCSTWRILQEVEEEICDVIRVGLLKLMNSIDEKARVEEGNE